MISIKDLYWMPDNKKKNIFRKVILKGLIKVTRATDLSFVCVSWVPNHIIAFI